MGYTDGVFKQAEQTVLNRPEVSAYFSNIGGTTVNTGMMMLTLKDKSQRPIDSKKKGP